MNIAQQHRKTEGEARKSRPLDMKLEAIVLPVSDAALLEAVLRRLGLEARR
uniref:Uncharacterized protein n=1 Tax=Rhizobium laguerreae TaxID=1076926 RepID=A0A6N9ZKT8_9HYPH|nr:hypothetical protein [Rhizobium laguerreae]